MPPFGVNPDTANHIRSIMRLGAVVLLCFSLLYLCGIGLTNDTGMIMHFTLHMLQGGLYARWITVNPPLIMLLYALPAYGILALHGHGALLLHGFTLLLCCMSLACTHHALRMHQVSLLTRRLWMVATAFALIAAPVLCSVFADREHMLFIFALPWIVQMLLRLKPLPYTAAIAAIGLCLKPHNLIIFVALLLLGGPEKQTLRQRLFAPSAWIIASVCTLYLLTVFIFFPLYLYFIVPLSLTTYAALSWPLALKVLRIALIFVPAWALIYEYVRPTRDKWLWFGFTLSAAADFCLNAGWTYTTYLLYVPLILLCARLWEHALSKEDDLEAAYRKHSGTAAAIVSTLLVLMAIFNLALEVDAGLRTNHASNFTALPEPLNSELQSEIMGQKFILLSMSLWSSSLTSEANFSRSVYAYDDFPWPLIWLYRHNGEPEAAQYKKQAIIRPLLVALSETPKPVIILDAGIVQRGLPDNADILSYIREDIDARAALANYRAIKTIDTCKTPRELMCKFTILRAD